MELMRWPELQAKIGGYSRVAVWRWEQSGKFPKRLKLSDGSVAWLSNEIDDWISKLAKERHDN
jgi:predicted DNA-binding transcriptional regulator AlpA